MLQLLGNAIPALVLIIRLLFCVVLQLRSVTLFWHRSDPTLRFPVNLIIRMGTGVMFLRDQFASLFDNRQCEGDYFYLH